MNAVSGVLLLDKPVGLTSHDVVNRVRKKLGIRRVGHAGTLDPDATGVLVVCIGEATRLIEFMTAEDKEYEGVVHFGVGTNTDDASGQPIAKANAAHLTLQEVNTAAKSFIGQQKQRVPLYSAVHIGGKRAYEYARQEQVVELPIKDIHIYSLEVLSFQQGEVSEAKFRTACSKGTYIRALCRDWGEKIGLPAHLSQLRRTQSGAFSISETTPLEVFEASDTPLQYIRSAVAGVQELTKTALPLSVVERLASGQSVPVTDVAVDLNEDELKLDEIFAVLTLEGSLAAIVQVKRHRNIPELLVLKPKKVFWKREP